MTAKDVKLVARTKPGKDRGGGAGGFAWEIRVDDETAGEVFINRVNEGVHKGQAFIEIYLNRENQGRKIGRIAYRLAAEKSGYDEVHAVMQVEQGFGGAPQKKPDTRMRCRRARYKRPSWFGQE
ncbi:MAG: hypothetical protein R3C25_15015 [Hyphomonadaceae bacterium]